MFWEGIYERDEKTKDPEVKILENITLILGQTCFCLF